MGNNQSAEIQRLTEMLQEALDMGEETKTAMEKMKKKHNREIKRLCKKKKEFVAELKKMKEDADTPRKDYNQTVKKALDIVKRARRKVALVVGAQGAGKSTICVHMFGIPDAITGTGNTHVTRDLNIYQSGKLPMDVVDTVGAMPDVRGIMRVLACAYKRGWDPAAIIVVHAGRSGHFDAAASFLKASRINTIKFEPNTFWRLMENGMDAQQSLAITVFKDDGDLQHTHSMEAFEYEIRESMITPNLLNALQNLSFEKNQRAEDVEGIGNVLAFYMAKCISNRASFIGTDIDFIDSK